MKANATNLRKEAGQKDREEAMVEEEKHNQVTSNV